MGSASEIPDQPRDGAWIELSVTVNGDQRTILTSSTRRLADLLRDELGLTGTKVGCAVGICGACTVLVDGAPTSSCVTLAAQVDECDVLTVEGLEAHDDARRVQSAFAEVRAFQCGFCTSGQLVNAVAVIRQGATDLDDRALGDRLHGNLCRCTGYYPIMQAIREAGA